LEYFDAKKPTIQFIGDFDPWTQEDTTLFKEALEKTGQVCIMIRDKEREDDNTTFVTIRKTIINALYDENIAHNKHYIVMKIPNITQEEEES